jgi:hypothetical protein
MTIKEIIGISTSAVILGVIGIAVAVNSTASTANCRSSIKHIQSEAVWLKEEAPRLALDATAGFFQAIGGNAASAQLVSKRIDGMFVLLNRDRNEVRWLRDKCILQSMTDDQKTNAMEAANGMEAALTKAIDVVQKGREALLWAQGKDAHK